MAAERPDMPPPMMTTSVSIRSGVGAMVPSKSILFVNGLLSFHRKLIADISGI